MPNGILVEVDLFQSIYVKILNRQNDRKFWQFDFLYRRRPRDFGYSLSRSKSVCDISTMSHMADDTESVKSAKVAHNRHVNYDTTTSRGSKSSRVVRNRTILGSFPLFYKLSQSLSSLNTTTTLGTGTTSSSIRCSSFQMDLTMINLGSNEQDLRYVFSMLHFCSTFEGRSSSTSNLIVNEPQIRPNTQF